MRGCRVKAGRLVVRWTMLLIGLATTVVQPGSLPAEAEEASLVRSVAPDWPQWRGPRRDGVSEEKGLRQTWPREGPPLLWKVSGMGRGYSSPIVVKDTLYVTGDVGEDLHVFALDLSGAIRWTSKNGAYWKQPWPGSRSACSYDAGRLYHMNAHGRLVCIEADTGKEVWSVNVLERFGARNVTWGRSEAVIVHGQRVFVTPAGEKGLMAALDKETGRTVWASPPLAEEKTSYTSPILIRMGERRLLVGTGSKHSFGVDANDGKLLWTFRHPVEENVLGATPALVKDSVFITNSSRDHSALYRLRLAAQGGKVERVWSRDFKNGQAALIVAAGRLYGADGRERRGRIAVVDPGTGKPAEAAESAPGVTFGAGAYADGRIYYLTQLGEVVLLQPTGAGAQVVGRFRLVEARKKDAWAHPVISKGRLFLRYHDTLFCYDVRRS